MSEEILKEKEIKLLQSVREYTLKNGYSFPSSKWLIRKLGITGKSVSSLCNLKKSLREKGYLEGTYTQCRLTEAGRNFRGLDLPIEPCYIPLLGEVSAGSGRQYEDLALYGDIDNLADLRPIAIPQLEGTQLAVAVQVKGVSMKAAGILPGDYLIIEMTNDYHIFQNNKLVLFQGGFDKLKPVPVPCFRISESA